MLQNNRELRYSLTTLTLATSALAFIGFCVSVITGMLVLSACLIVTVIFLLTERYRYRKLQKISTGLDNLLINGTPLRITEYNEGELSILANQIQKITLLLKESADVVKADKKYLADSLADISHQLRTPLTSMNLTVSILQNPQLSDEKRIDLFRELRNLLTRTEWLVETLLKISKLDAETIKMNPQDIRVKDLIVKATEPLEVPMDLRNQQLSIHCGNETFSVDLNWTAEALSNILKNCAEHTPAGGAITIQVSENALFTQIDVQDTGSGFDPNDIPHLFERFYKGSNASENSYGIGLALARTVIAAQNGSIQAMNGDNGARFIIKFYKQVI